MSVEVREKIVMQSACSHADSQSNQNLKWLTNKDYTWNMELCLIQYLILLYTMDHIQIICKLNT